MAIAVFVFWFAQSVASATPLESGGQAPASGVLEQLVADLDARNPELVTARRQIDVARASVGPAGVPPDPLLTMAYMGGVARPPFVPAGSDAAGFREFGVSQDVPWRGTLTARSKVAAAQVAFASEGLDVVRADVVARLKTAYVDYVFADRSGSIIDRFKSTLEQLARTAEARFSVGKATQQDVLRAQVEVTRAIERRAQVDRQRRLALVEVNRLVARPAETPVPIADPELTLPDTDMPSGVEHTAGHVSAHVRHHDAAVDRAQLEADLLRKEQRPSLMVDVFVRRPGGGLPWMSGAGVKISLPIFAARKQQPKLQAAQLVVEAAKADRDRILTEVDSMTGAARVHVDASRRLLDLYDDSLRPQTRLTFESAMSAYEVGNVDFLTLLTSSLAVFDVELSAAEQRAQLQRALVSLEPLVGRELVK